MAEKERQYTTLEEICLVDKPKGISSFDVIRILRKKLGIRKMGHAGTLDPAASGLLIIGIGAGTKKLTRYLKLDKTYQVEIQLGIRTNTGDLDGNIVETKPVPPMATRKLKAVINSMHGTISLPVPRYSAVKLKGKPLYAYARGGMTFKPPVKTMAILAIENQTYDSSHQLLHMLITVSSGTYVRSIAEEIGRRLDTTATVRNLRRVSIGHFSVSDAIQLSSV